jgi:hypothetical protein
MEAVITAVQSAVPKAKMRRSSFVLLSTKASDSRRRLVTMGVDLRYHGSFYLEDIGILDSGSAFGFVKNEFEYYVSAGNFTANLHVSATSWGAASLKNVISSSAIMTRIFVETADSQDELQDKGFFANLPLYGKWLFSLAMCMLAIGVTWFSYNTYVKANSHKSSTVHDNLIEDFTALKEGQGEDVSTWGLDGKKSGFEAPREFLEQASSAETKRTPLSIRSSSSSTYEHRFLSPIVSPLNCNAESQNIVELTSAHHLELAADAADEDNDVFGY